MDRQHEQRADETFEQNVHHTFPLEG
jgi:hypothetical protein